MIYLTEYDDEDEDLRFGCQLFLFKARVNETRRNLVAGVYTRVTMEDIIGQPMWNAATT